MQKIIPLRPYAHARQTVFFVVSLCHLLVILVVMSLSKAPRFNTQALTKNEKLLILTQLDVEKSHPKPEQKVVPTQAKKPTDHQRAKPASPVREEESVTPIPPENQTANIDGLSWDQSREKRPSHSLTDRLRLTLPQRFEEVPQTLTPAQQASIDVRSNSVKLSKAEKFSISMGEYGCVFQKRLADGKVLRVPGKWVKISARTVGDFKPLATAQYCVRLNQNEAQFGNDMTEISAGFK